ncbi:hypothetical protein [Paraurantiacibacter namhicola]|uniref:Uncharacterized protein n=1 Tax=Paraurantiacibacter namhicola TaxID=645517 RepID=A0A1C7D6F1_9SPHN|nr:hypothetical protein [Paraurantiacibacter namhicola]ANU06901.1 hypothetical protein A6F65_00578 [Paraurantiacibacter namhicola]
MPASPDTQGGSRPSLFQRPLTWCVSFFASFALIAFLRITDAINGTTGFILMALSMSLLVPMVRAASAEQRRQGFISPAITRYNKRFMAASAGYVLGLGLAITINDRIDLGTGETVLIALLPIIPVFGMIWTMARYIVEEEDEFLRHRATMASLTGLALVLGLGTFWGFLETFGVVPHIWAWWVFPVWAMGMGLSQGWMALSDRRGDNA